MYVASLYTYVVCLKAILTFKGPIDTIQSFWCSLDKMSIKFDLIVKGENLCLNLTV